MNKKDCEHIGFILSNSKDFEELKYSLFEMDTRIEPEFIAFEEVAGRSKEVDDLAEKLMDEAHKENHEWYHWSMLKKENLNRTYGECLEEARKTVYGEDYHPSLFR